MIGKQNNPALCWNGSENIRDWEKKEKFLTPETSYSYSTQLTPEYIHIPPTQRALEIQSGVLKNKSY